MLLVNSRNGVKGWFRKRYSLWLQVAPEANESYSQAFAGLKKAVLTWASEYLHKCARLEIVMDGVGHNKTSEVLDRARAMFEADQDLAPLVAHLEYGSFSLGPGGLVVFKNQHSL